MDASFTLVIFTIQRWADLMRLRWIIVLALLAGFFGWKYFDDDKKEFELKRAIDFKGVVERMKEKKRLEQLERAKSKD